MHDFFFWAMKTFLHTILKHSEKRSVLNIIETDHWVTNTINLYVSGTNYDIDFKSEAY